VLGGEGAHGMLILSPRAVERLESYKPAWPMPKIFRMTKGGKLIEGIFEGETINTPSMLCVEDYIDALNGREGRRPRRAREARRRQHRVIADWFAKTDWIDFLAKPKIRSNTSVCLKVVDPKVTALPADAGRLRQGARLDAREGSAPTTSAPIATRLPACASGAARPSRRAMSRR
jgi:phosphoserine aminotransferase